MSDIAINLQDNITINRLHTEDQPIHGRNEHFIASNHPIKKRLIQQMGKTHIERNRFVWKTYEDAKTVIRYTWEGIKGYNPQTDPFYKTFVRSLCR